MRERIKAVMARVFGVSESSIQDSSTVDNLPEWDSLRHIELMLALETEFGVHISTDAMLELLSLTAIEHHLQKQSAVPAG